MIILNKYFDKGDYYIVFKDMIHNFSYTFYPMIHNI